ncbi:MAG TPA: hypothetical protein VK666_01830, partial [Chryseolinea sp.]|nr:hypothetical protein [Chryseolinea sp.]
GEDTTALSIRNTIEVAGLPIKYNGEKEYLFGRLPIADAFIAWGHTAPKMAEPYDLPAMVFHGYSIGLFAVLSVLFWFCVDRREG